MWVRLPSRSLMKKIFDSYYATEDGEIYSTKTNKFLKQRLSKNGYKYVNLSINNKCKTYQVHRLIALVYIPNPNNLPQVNHKNGIKIQNNVENLEWVTSLENVRHAHNNGLMHPARGLKTNNGHFTEDEVRYIRSLKGIYTYKEIANMYNVTKGTITQLMNKMTYKYID